MDNSILVCVMVLEYLAHQFVEVLEENLRWSGLFRDFINVLDDLQVGVGVLLIPVPESIHDERPILSLGDIDVGIDIVALALLKWSLLLSILVLLFVFLWLNFLILLGNGYLLPK
jgi:hypothetical protein